MDVRFGLRALSGHPRSTFISVLTLAIAIGVNSSIVSLANAVLFKRLAYPDPSRIVTIAVQNPPGVIAIPEAEIAAAIRSARAIESSAVISEDSFHPAERSAPPRVARRPDVRCVRALYRDLHALTAVELTCATPVCVVTRGAAVVKGELCRRAPRLMRAWYPPRTNDARYEYGSA